MVVWAQEHLIAAGEDIPVTGVYGKLTIAAVRAYQEAHALLVDGAIGTTTWQSLLNFTPYRTPWSGSHARAGAGASSSRARPPSRPLSASLPAKAYEIDPGPAP
jgi:peptidoglycan hydrolase-like protein with peptidoglycan-binding domain